MKSKSGFTLIELLVVIAIIGILSAVVLTSLNSSRDRARDARSISNVKQVALAYELSRNQTTGNFPSGSSPTLTGLSPIPSGVVIVSNGSNNGAFCVYATLINTTAGPGTWYVASHAGSTYRTGAVTPTLADCDAS